jgi:hypothetical protein
MDIHIKNEAIRYVWATWYFFVVIMSLIGDTIILYSTIKYKAIELHVMIVTFIQHIAVSNILISVTYLLPTAVSLIAGEWIFGPALCQIRPYLSYPVYEAGRFLICGMTVCKLLILKYPLQSFNWSAGHAHLACTFIWFLSLVWPLSFLLVKKDDEAFEYILYSCSYQFTSSVWKVLLPVVTVILELIPNLIIVVAAGMILCVARKVAKESRRGLKWQGVLTVVFTAGVYSIAFLPKTVYHIGKPFVGKDSLKI